MNSVIDCILKVVFVTYSTMNSSLAIKNRNEPYQSLFHILCIRESGCIVEIWSNVTTWATHKRIKIWMTSSVFTRRRVILQKELLFIVCLIVVSSTLWVYYGYHTTLLLMQMPWLSTWVEKPIYSFSFHTIQWINCRNQVYAICSNAPMSKAYLWL